MNPFRSWTLKFLAIHAPVMELRSAWRYRDFVIRADRGQVQSELLPLRMRAPVDRTIYLREAGSDRLTFQEVFVDRVYQCVMDLIPSCTSMIDLGANIGLASLYLSTRYQCPVFAVEPNPVTFKVLSRNLSRSDREHCIQAGVWSKPAVLSGGEQGETSHYSMFSTVESPAGEITGLPMSELLARSGFSKVDLLKVDIEGAERELFTGDLSWLSSVGAIAIEFHGESRSEAGFDAIMEQHQFRIASGDGHTVVAVRKQVG